MPVKVGKHLQRLQPLGAHLLRVLVAGDGLGELRRLMVAVPAILLSTWWAGFFKTLEMETHLNWSQWVFFSLLIAGLCWSARDFLIIQYYLLRLLRKLAFHHLGSVFEQLPPKSSRGLSTSLIDSPPTLVELQESHEQMIQIRDKFESIDKSGWKTCQLKALPQELNERVVLVGDSLNTELKKAGSNPFRLWALPSETHKKLCEQSAYFFEVLCHYWEDGTYHGLPAGTKAAVAEGFQMCERFVAFQIVAYLNAVFMYLRYLIVCIVSAIFFLLLATSSYPYAKQNLMMNFAWTLVLIFSSMHLYSFLNFNRNEIIQAIRSDKGRPGGVNRLMISQFVVFGALPAVAFLASKFPSLGRLLFAWVGPIVKSLNL